jgi:hypothetical protein
VTPLRQERACDTVAQHSSQYELAKICRNSCLSTQRPGRKEIGQHSQFYEKFCFMEHFVFTNAVCKGRLQPPNLRQAHLPSRETTSLDLQENIGDSTLLTSIALGILFLSSANQWLAREVLDWHARWSKLISQSGPRKGAGSDATRFLLDRRGLISPDRSGCSQSRDGGLGWQVI